MIITVALLNKVFSKVLEAFPARLTAFDLDLRFIIHNGNLVCIVYIQYMI